MPIKIAREMARELLPQLDDALKIVCNEFEGLDRHRAYHNAFYRALKPDPLRRVLMLGNDQRDLFVPLLRQTVAQQVPAGGRIFDIGAGDGQTFACVADAVQAGASVSILEPNPAYLATYQVFLEHKPHLVSGTACAATLEDLQAENTSRTAHLPQRASIDLALGLHVIYYTPDVARCLQTILSFLKPGGTFFNVVTDETTAYSGAVTRSFLEASDGLESDGGFFASVEERRRLLAPESEGGGGLAEVVRAAGMEVDVVAVRQPSRMYGHTLADLLALVNINALNSHSGTRKFECAARVLHDRPDAVDLRIETEGARMGMWSVVQPQWVTQVRRVR
jgi:SAM-dependent methyltransferase